MTGVQTCALPICFTGLGNAERFARDSDDRVGIVVQRVNVSIELAARLGFFGDFAVESKHFLPHSLVLADERQIPDPDAHQPGKQQQPDHDARQLIPNTIFNVHAGSKASDDNQRKKRNARMNPADAIRTG